MQQAGDHAEPANRVVTGDIAGHFGGELGVGVQRFERETGNGFCGVEGAEDFHGEDEIFQNAFAEISDGRIDVADIAGDSEEGGVYQLQNLGGHGRIAFDQQGDAPRSAIGISEGCAHFDAGFRERRQLLHGADDAFEALVIQDAVEAGGALDGGLQGVLIAGLHKKLVRDRHGVESGFQFGVAGKNDAKDAGILFAHGFEQSGAIHSGHAHIGNDHVERSGLHHLQRGLTAGSERHFPDIALRTQHALQAFENPAFIIHKNNSLHDASTSLGAATPWVGRRTQNVVPWPISVSKVSVPPCFSTTMARARARPWPEPLPTSLVVKKGSKIFPRTPSGTPVPLSCTATTTESPSSRVLTVMRPFSPVTFMTSPMAWAALTNRFRKTWLRSPR